MKDQPVGLRLDLFYFGVPLLLDEANQSISGGIMGGHGRAALQLRLNFLGQLLPQLHSARQGWKRMMSHILETTPKHKRFLSNSPPLVKAVDVPHDALNEDLVLIHGCRGNSRRCLLGPFFLPFPPHPSDPKPASHPSSPHSPIKAPRMKGVSLVNTIELVGRFPSKTCRKQEMSSAMGRGPGAFGVSIHILPLKASSLQKRSWKESKSKGGG